MADLHFRLDARRPAQRRIAVTLEADRAALLGRSRAGATGELFLPVWTPGSYLVREYARHLGPVTATDAGTGRQIECSKATKNRYRLALPGDVQRIRVCYEVLAHELSVRTADLTPEHAYWNHACLLLWPVGGETLDAEITVAIPPGWELACSLTRATGADGAIALQAPDLDTALDAPVLAGRFTRMDWRVLGVPHTLVLDGLGAIRPPDHFLADLTRLVEQAAQVFGGGLPYESYLFLCLFADTGHGGLEHAASTTLLSARTALRPGKDYQEFLSLCAHELFHVWNGKRMRPQELWRYDYERENYTSMLWLIEGFTAYYDDLLCRRAGLLTPEEYLALLARNLDKLRSGPGRLQQSLAEASFDAWIRLYRPDADTRNSTQNYYGNGAVAALLLDLEIRRATAGGRSLDDVLRTLFQRTFLAGRGYSRSDFEGCLAEAAGRDLAPLLRSLVDGPLDPDVEGALRPFGIEVTQQERDRPYVGMSLDEAHGTVTFVSRGGPACESGVAPGDELLALEGIRVTGSTFGEVFRTLARVDQPLRLLTSSRGLLQERLLVPRAPPHGTCSLQIAAEPPPEQLHLRRGWLGA